MSMGASIEVYVNKASRLMAARIEEAIRNLMKAENLTVDDLRNRCVIVHQPNGEVLLTLDGKPRLKWFEGTAPPVHDAPQEEGTGD